MPEYRYASGCLIIPWMREASEILSSALMAGNPFVGSFNAVGRGGSSGCGRWITKEMLVWMPSGVPFRCWLSPGFPAGGFLRHAGDKGGIAFRLVSLWRLRRVGQIPAVTIGIKEAVLIHEAVILRFFKNGASRRQGFLNQFVHLGSAVASEGMPALEEPGGVTCSSLREYGKQGFHIKHGLDGVADGKANTVLSGGLLVHGEPKCGVKCPRSIHVLGGKVNDDLATHGGG